LTGLCELFTKRFGIKKLIFDTPSEVVGTRLCWHEWLNLADYADDNLPAEFLPRTRDYVRKLALQERKVVRDLAGCRDCKQAAARLVNNPFTCRLCPEIPAKNVIRQIPVMRTKKDMRLLNKNKIFRRWLTHCRISLLMDILALADIEFCKNHILPESATVQRLRSASMVAPILPSIRYNKSELPLPLLFERFRQGKQISWRKLARYIGGRTALQEKWRMLKRWRSGKRRTSDYSIQRFLSNLLQHESEEFRAVALLRYRIALLLTNLHARVKKLRTVTRAQRLQMFHTFHKHRERHFRMLRRIPLREGQTSPRAGRSVINWNETKI